VTFSLHRNYSFAFLICGLLILWFTRSAPIADFGNYYYGSKLIADGKFSILDYQSIHHFNEQIKTYGERNYFENYTPVPPFSLVFFLPFTGLDATTAKFVFNLISLLVFCLSYHRLTKHLKLESPAFWFLPLLVLYPLYTNLLQGQSYLLISALMMEGFIAFEKKQTILSALLFSPTICLKVFTGFILLFFVLKKDVRTVVVTVLAIVALMTLTFFIVDAPTITYYFTEILPRLAQNEILEPYHYSSQGLHTFLLNLFSYDPVQNPNPLLDNMFLVLAIEAIFLGFVIAGLISLSKKQDTLFLFSVTLFSTLLFSKHSATYSLLLTIPFYIWLAKSMTSFHLIIIALILFAVNIPPQLLSSYVLPVQYMRLWLFILAFLLTLRYFKAKIKLVHFSAFVILFFGLGAIGYSKHHPNYFKIQNTKGALFSYEQVNDSLILQSCYGENDLNEGFHFKGALKSDPTLLIKEKKLFYRGHVVCEDGSNKLKPMLLNDTSVLFLSDLKQGVGFYKLRILSLPKK
jgi:hypothetical protein